MPLRRSLGSYFAVTASCWVVNGCTLNEAGTSDLSAFPADAAPPSTYSELAEAAARMTAPGEASAPADDTPSMATQEAAVEDQVSAPPPTLPPDANDVAIWLDADKGVTTSNGRVSRWADQSQAHNDFAQSNASSQPTVVSSSTAGHAVVRFERDRKTVLMANDTASLHFGTGGFAVLLAAADKNPISGGHGQSVGTIFGKQQLGNSPAEITFAFNWFTTETTPDEPALHIGIGEIFAGTISNFRKYNDGKFRVITGSWGANGKAIEMSIRVNGKVDGTGRQNDAPDLSLPGQPFRLGETYGQAATADIAEVVVIQGTPSVTEVEAWEGYLMSKFGVSP